MFQPNYNLKSIIPSRYWFLTQSQPELSHLNWTNDIDCLSRITEGVTIQLKAPCVD